MADSVLERLLAGSALLGMMTDVSAAEGGAYSLTLPLFALGALWTANPRGLLVYIVLNALSILFDIAYLGAQASGAYGERRPDAAVAFTSINLLVKAAICYFAHLEFLRIGGTYSQACPTTSSTMSSGGGAGAAGAGPLIVSPVDGHYKDFQSGGGAEFQAPSSPGYDPDSSAYNAPPSAPSAGGYQS